MDDQSFDHCHVFDGEVYKLNGFSDSNESVFRCKFLSYYDIVCRLNVFTAYMNHYLQKYN